MKLNRFAGFCALLLLLCVQWARTQTGVTEEQLKSDYVGKVLTLRHFYQGSHFRFQPDGTLTSPAEIGSWTVEGQFTVKKIQAREGVLEIKGRRISVGFDYKTKQFQTMPDPASTETPSSDAARAELEKFRQERDLDIEIELPSRNPSQAEILAAMNAVFLANSESMLNVVPGYWAEYFAKSEGTPEKASSLKIPATFLGPSSGVTAPQATFSPDPSYTVPARILKYQGVILMSLVVDSTGTPTDIQITQPLGLGLDENAVATVSTWKFNPARKGAEPVPVKLTIEVEFRLY
jgi:TonB family protein